MYIGALCAAGYLDAADYPDGFGQEQPMTRLEVVKLLVRAGIRRRRQGDRNPVSRCDGGLLLRRQGRGAGHH